MFSFYPIKGGLENVEGFFCGGINCGLKAGKENDLGFIRSDEELEVSALFTSNSFQAAPIVHFKKYPKGFKTNFLLLNSKNANALTGDAGVLDIEEIFKALGEKIELKNPIMSSTGVIGYRLNKEKITSAFDRFDFNSCDSNGVARAIMTTDSFKKELCLKVELENGEFFHIAAICKGAGMINPAMATMLCFICTDAKIPVGFADEALKEAIKYSFNAISVDGDTSTNDTVMLLSSGKSGVFNEDAFSEALAFLTKQLALEIVKDGEGATKLVAFEVSGAKNEDEAMRAAKALSNSLLVKTALFGEDPNWGRIASTIGASRVSCDVKKFSIHYDDVLVYDEKNPQLDSTREELAAKVMKKDSFKISSYLGVGEASFTAFGCDLGHKYVSINADYRS